MAVTYKNVLPLYLYIFTFLNEFLTVFKLDFFKPYIVTEKPHQGRSIKYCLYSEYMFQAITSHPGPGNITNFS